MKILNIALLSVVLQIFYAFGQPAVVFEEYFENATLRIDYLHVGNAQQESFMLDKIYRTGSWAGTTTNLTGPPDLGKYFYKVYDKSGEKLLFARGFDTYFTEYQTTKPGIDGIKKSYHESALVPFPKEKMVFVIEKRNRNQKLRPVFTKTIDPKDISIIAEAPVADAEVIESVISGQAHEKVDIVILAEGYTKGQKVKFTNDLNRFTSIFFAWEPYKKMRTDFNIRGVFVASADSGVDEPRKKIYRNTVFKCTFNSLDSERYLMTEDNKTIQDYAGVVPYDAIFIMVNTSRYGGGGIYNSFSTFSSDGPWHDFVFHHEFGHSFAGLADEYFSSEDTYEEFFPRGIEPVQPNITALLDPQNVKWKEFLTPGIDVPTPWNREEYEALTGQFAVLRKAHEEKMDILRERDVPADSLQVEESMYRLRVNEVRKAISDFFADHPLKGKVGVFQGAGYDPDGFYRPTINSVMHRFSRSETTFYPVNEAHIKKIIDYYTD